MNFLKGLKIPTVVGVLIVIAFFSSCEQDLTTVGDGLIGELPFTTDKVVYGVTAVNKKIAAVQTNRLPVYQLGVYDDPVYGKTEARITTQVQLISANPTFGIYTQDEEDNDTDYLDENETIDSVVVYIPYFTNITDSDFDGVPDALESGDDITDSTNDSDGDGVANNDEATNGTNPLVVDTDGDGFDDADDDENDLSDFAETFKLDSIYGDRTQTFGLKIERSTYFLRDLDPDSSFQDAQEYYSNQQFSPMFTEEVLYDTSNNVISDKEYLLFTAEDDPDTESVDETLTVETRLGPGIRARLTGQSLDFFQRNLLDKEGSSELLSTTNFLSFFRGLHISVTPSEEELLFLFDIANAGVEVYYHYDKIDIDDDDDDEDFEEIVVETSSYGLSFLGGSSSTALIGNAVNTIINDAYSTEITDAIADTENASRIYLKGGPGTFAEIQLFEDDEEIALLKENNWIINEAHLVFYIDQEAMGTLGEEPPRLYLYNAETNLPLYNTLTEISEEDSSLGIYLNYDGIIETSSDRGVKYTVNITDHINNIIVRDSTNATLGLQVTADVRITGINSVILDSGEEKELPAAPILTPLGTVLYGSNVPTEEEANKLQLEIFYTETN